MVESRRHFVQGMGSVLDLTGTASRLTGRVGEGLNLQRTTGEAIGEDWLRIASDLWAAYIKIVEDRGSHVKSK